jgi:hypothetical protein
MRIDIPHPDISATGTSAPSTGERDWPALRLDMTPTVEPFPLDVLPRPVRDFIEAVSRSIGCPPDFVGVPSLVVAGAAVGRSVLLSMRSGQLVSASLYAMNVGGPSSGKSPALEMATRPLWRIDERLHAEYRRAKQKFDAAMEEYKNAPNGEKPPRPEMPSIQSAVVSDTTREALVSQLMLNPRGLLMTLDEGSALVASLNQYKNGRGDDRQFYLSALFGKTIRSDRKNNPNGEPLRVPDPFLSVIGNIPPDMLTTFREERGRADGFIERILFAFPDARPRSRWNEEGIPESVTETWARIVEKLWAIPMSKDREGPSPNTIWFSGEAKNAWVNWYNAHVDQMNHADGLSDDLAAEGKLMDFAGRLVLVLHMLTLASDAPGKRWSAIPPVPESAVSGAIRLWGYFRSHYRRVRANMGGNGPAGAPAGARLILRWIENHPDVGSFPESELSRAYPPSRGYTPAMFEDGLKWLRERHCMRLVPRPDEPSGRRGRKPSPTWEIHPDLRRVLGKQEIQDNLSQAEPTDVGLECTEPYVIDWGSEDEPDAETCWEDDEPSSAACVGW